MTDAETRPAGASFLQTLQNRARAQPFDRRVMAAGIVVGVATGCAAFALHLMLESFSELRGRMAEIGPVVGPLFTVLLPALGGLIAGWLTRRRYPAAGGHGVAEVARAINEKDGHIPGHVAWVKTLASASTIGFGGSAGLEGPVVQIGSSVGSALGRLFGSPPRDLKTFVAAGAVGGLSAAYGIPLAGVFFTMEVILKDFANEAFPAVVVSSVTGAVVSRVLMGGAAMMAPSETFQWANNSDLLLYGALGVACAVLGRAYFGAIHFVEHHSESWEFLPDWGRPALGGLAVGALTLAFPLVGGTGAQTSSALLSGASFGWRSLALALGKIAATALTLGSGGSGGALTPSLFVGAAAGSGWGQAMTHLGLASSAAGPFALAGMCGVFTAAFSAPITGMMIGVEMTRDYGMLVPIMVCCAVAQVASRRQS